MNRDTLTLVLLVGCAALVGVVAVRELSAPAASPSTGTSSTPPATNTGIVPPGTPNSTVPAPGTMYAGGSASFDETTGTYRGTFTLAGALGSVVAAAPPPSTQPVTVSV